MEKLEGIKNMVRNVKPVMMKLHNGEKLTKEEKQQIVQFYLEVTHVVFTN